MEEDNAVRCQATVKAKGSSQVRRCRGKAVFDFNENGVPTKCYTHSEKRKEVKSRQQCDKLIGIIADEENEIVRREVYSVAVDVYIDKYKDIEKIKEDLERIFVESRERFEYRAENVMKQYLCK